MPARENRSLRDEAHTGMQLLKNIVWVIIAQKIADQPDCITWIAWC